MPTAVSDSSTLIHLARIGRLNLLNVYFEQVLIPPAVWREVVEEGRGRPGVREVEEASWSGWLTIVAPTRQDLLDLLRLELDEGEAEAIVLALERQVEVILLDESDGRRVANALGLQKTGVIGILMRAKLEGKILSLRRELDRLRQEAGFWIREELYQRALQAVGEAGRPETEGGG